MSCAYSEVKVSNAFAMLLMFLMLHDLPVHPQATKTPPGRGSLVCHPSGMKIKPSI